MIDSPFLSGEGNLTVTPKALCCATGASSQAIPYAQMISFRIENYRVLLETEQGRFTFSRLGKMCDPFYTELYRAYNEKVLQAFFVGGAPYQFFKQTFGRKLPIG